MFLIDWIFDGLSWLFRKVLAPGFGLEPKDLERDDEKKDDEAPD